MKFLLTLLHLATKLRVAGHFFLSTDTTVALVLFFSVNVICEFCMVKFVQT